MTPQELLDMATRSAREQIAVASESLNQTITAGERIHARGVSDALSKVALALATNPTS